MTQRLFYLEQASKCASAAGESRLANQRDKFLAAEQAWRNLADMPTMLSAFRASAIMHK